jgi:hypothetical protein
MKTGLGIIAAFALALFASQAQAQSRSQADFDAKAQQVCGNDVFRLCGDAVPDRGRIEACMRRKISQVSSPCRKLMAGYGRGQRGERRATQHRRHSTHHHASRHHYTSGGRKSRHTTHHHNTRHHHEYSDRR